MTITVTKESGIKIITTLEVREAVTNLTEEIDIYTDSLYLDYNITLIYVYIRTVVKPEYISNSSLKRESSGE